MAAPALLDSMARAEVRARPFRHWRLAHVLPEQMAGALAALPLEPPALGGVSGRRELHNPQRRYFAGELLARRPAARALAEALQSAPVVSAWADLAGVALAGGYLRMEYALDVDGFWLEPHTDIGAKWLTVFIQLAAPGQADLGTDLYASPTVWAERTPFVWNGATAFVPSDHSWHGFEPRPIAGVRRSIIVNYVSPDWCDREQLAFPDRPVG